MPENLGIWSETGHSLRQKGPLSYAQPLEQSRRSISQSKRPFPFEKWQASALPQNKPVITFKPFALVFGNAIDDFCYSNYAASFKLARVNPESFARRTIDVQGSMNEEWSAVFRGPAPVFDVFGALRNQVGPRLSDRQYFHGAVPVALIARTLGIFFLVRQFWPSIVSRIFHSTDSSDSIFCNGTAVAYSRSMRVRN